METKSIDFLNGNPYKSLLKFAIPIIIAQILDGLYLIFDSYLVGVLGDQSATVGIGSVSNIIILVNFLFVGLGSGGTFLLGQYVGAKSKNGIKKTLKNLIVLFSIVTVLVMIVIFALYDPFLKLLNLSGDAYIAGKNYLFVIVGTLPLYSLNLLLVCILRGFGNSRVPLFISGSAAILRIIFDVIFVYCTNLSTIGIGLSSALSLFISCVVGIYFVWRSKDTIDFSGFFKSSIDTTTFWRIIKYGLPIAGYNFFPQIVGIYTSSISNKLGNIAATSYIPTGFVLADKFSNLLYFAEYGVSMALLTAVATCLGALDVKKTWKYLRISYLYTAILILIMSAICYPLFPYIFKAYGASQEAIDFALGRLYIIGFDCLLCIFILPLSYLFMGSGRSVIIMIFNLFTMLGVRLPMMIWMDVSNISNPYLLTLPMPVSTAVTTILSIIYLYSKKWTVLKKLPVIEDIKKEAALEAAK